MQQISSNIQENNYLVQQLIEYALKKLESLGYSQNMLKRFRRTWKKLADFAHEVAGQKHFSQELVENFLEFNQIPLCPNKPPSREERHIRTSMRILSDIALHGYPHSSKCIVQRKDLLPAMQKALDGYINFYIARNGICRTSQYKHRLYVCCFLHFVTHSGGATKLSDICSSMFSDFVISHAHLHSSTLCQITNILRSFMRYLYLQGILSEDLSMHVPKVRLWRDNRIPTIWTSDEVERLLSTVDRTSPKGKRDYAILILAARLGMRAGDIKRLRLECLQWDNARIQISQSKTGNPLVLPLTEEVGWALIDYLRNGRPVSEYREVFLTGKAPFYPFGHDTGLQHIINYYRRLAGIKIEQNSGRGIHSLRHTVASRLLQKGTPLETIGDILGHLKMESTRKYTKVDIDALQKVALDPEEVWHV